MSNLNDDYWHSLIKNAAGLHEANSGSQDFAGAFLSPYPNVSEAVETRLAGKKLGGQDSVRKLATLESVMASDMDDDSVTIVEFPAGTKVAFVASTEALFSYKDAPEPKSAGEVVSVKTASGTVTSYNGRVFVRWEDGKVRGIAAKHLEKRAGTVRQSSAPGQSNMMRVASLGDLSNFLKIGSDTLVHKATKDLWKLSQDSSGYKIERLFNDTGSPLKV